MKKIFTFSIFLILTYANTISAIDSEPPNDTLLDIDTTQSPPEEELSSTTNHEIIEIPIIENDDIIQSQDNIPTEPHFEESVLPQPHTSTKNVDTNTDAPIIQKSTPLETIDSVDPSPAEEHAPATKEPDDPPLPTASIFLNEILAKPDPAQNEIEFIEIYNATDHSVSLTDWQIYDKTGITNTSKRYIFTDTTIEAYGLLTLFYKKDHTFILNDTNEEIYLATPENDIVSSYAYKKAQTGLSWNSANVWYEESPTPNTPNAENPLTKDYPFIIINEIFPNPQENEGDNEFIEIYNPFDKNILLKNWILKDASLSGSYTMTHDIVPAHDYLTIYRSNFSFALNNSGNETVSLIAPNGITTSQLTYTTTREGMSFNYAHDWYWAMPTPGAQNTTDPRTLSYDSLLLSEILPNPTDNENTDEYIEIYNPHDIPLDIKDWTLHDDSQTGSYTFTHSTIIPPHAYYAVYRDTFTFALNNSNETVSLIAPNEKVTSTTTYKSSREATSYNYDLDTHQWRWSKHLTPHNPNIFNNLPTITKYDIDDAIYKNVYAEFAAKARDTDDEELKVRWDFGDGHKSYKWETRHKYDDNDTFYGSLRIQDESEEIIKDFVVHVQDYPKIDVSITKILPNPAGKDTENEYIVIKNKSNKKINLKNWSIATGTKTKTLVNHPVHGDLFIDAKKTKIISHKHAALTLPNKTGVIDIRRPDGSSAYIKKYGNTHTTIPENATYEKIDGTWQWIIPPDTEKIARTQMIITQALHNELLFSQQLLEQKIAYSAIYNIDDISNKKRALQKTHGIHTFFHTLNHFISKMIRIINQEIYAYTQPQNTHTYREIYIIPDAQNPCDNPHIPTQHTYMLCK